MVEADMPTAAPAVNQVTGAPPTTQEMKGTGVKVATSKGLVDIAQVQAIAQRTIPSDAPLVKMISSNQSQEYFAVATTQGFEIIQNDSSSNKLKKKIQILNESVELIEMMYKTNFIVLVLSASPNKVVIWDDFERKNRTEISFNSVIRNIRLRKDMLVVVLDTKTFIFSFMNLKLIENIETGPNPNGLCGLAAAEKAISKTLVVMN